MCAIYMEIADLYHFLQSIPTSLTTTVALCESLSRGLFKYINNARYIDVVNIKI